MKKRLFSLLCALTLLLGAVTSAAALEGESQQAARTLAALHVIDAVPSESALKDPATRRQSTELLVRLYGVTTAQREVSAQEYAISKGWVTVSSGQKEPVPTGEFCASLLRQLGYEGFNDSNAALFARRIGLTFQDYGETLTLGDLYQIVRDSLTFPSAEGVTAAQRLADAGFCTQAQADGLLETELTARQIADRSMSAVFRLDTYYTEKAYRDNRSGNGGSGFFISADGLAVTNYHTIEDAVIATATLITGETFLVDRVLLYDPEADLALLRISKTSTDKTEVPFFSYLELAEEPALRRGDRIYTLGVPLGITPAISEGIVSATDHQVERFTVPCVVNTADISHGSSGGALVNIYGHVVGVTSGAYESGNSLYISVPLTLILEADWTAEGVTLLQMTEEMKARS